MKLRSVGIGLEPIGSDELEGVSLDGVGVLGDDGTVVVQISIVDLARQRCYE
jgi:hypothetical protein